MTCLRGSAFPFFLLIENPPPKLSAGLCLLWLISSVAAHNTFSSQPLHMYLLFFAVDRPKPLCHLTPMQRELAPLTDQVFEATSRRDLCYKLSCLVEVSRIGYDASSQRSGWTRWAMMMMTRGALERMSSV